MKRFLIPAIVFILYRLLRWSWRVEMVEPEEMKVALREKKAFIYAHWHGDELALLQMFSLRPIATIVSTSDDGEMMNKLVTWMGGKTSRGSSTRGGVGALKGLIRLVREGFNCSFAVDGPKGPLHKVKPGVFEISRMLGLPIYWSGVACDRAWVFPKSWNKTYLPKPFARVRIVWLGPLPAIPDDEDPRSEHLALDLESKLNAARQQVKSGFFADLKP